MLINCPPQIMEFAIDFQKYLIKVPFITCLSTSAAELIGILLAKGAAPLANSLVGHNNATGCHQFLDITIAEGKTEIEPDRVADNLGWKAVADVGG